MQGLDQPPRPDPGGHVDSGHVDSGHQLDRPPPGTFLGVY